MKPSEAKVVAQCVADMIDVDVRHSIREVPLKLNGLVQEYLATYVPDKADKPIEIVETGSSTVK